MDGPDLRAIAEWVVLAAAAVAGFVTIWRFVVVGLIARPLGRAIGKAVRRELGELGDEVFTRLSAELLVRMGRVEGAVDRLAGRVALLEEVVEREGGGED